MRVSKGGQDRETLFPFNRDNPRTIKDGHYSIIQKESVISLSRSGRPEAQKGVPKHAQSSFNNRSKGACSAIQV